MAGGKIDRQADTQERCRKNWQSLITGAGTGYVTVASPLHNDGTTITLGYAINETPTGTINGINAAFTLANTPLAGTLMVWVNGLMMLAGGDYNLAGTTITFVAGAIPESGDWIRVAYLK
jgi:hypothetical protein